MPCRAQNESFICDIVLYSEILRFFIYISQDINAAVHLVKISFVDPDFFKIGLRLIVLGLGFFNWLEPNPKTETSNKNMQVCKKNHIREIKKMQNVY